MSKGRDANPKIVIPSLSLTKAKCLATPSNWLLLFLIKIYGRYNESTVRKKMAIYCPQGSGTLRQQLLMII